MKALFLLVLLNLMSLSSQAMTPFEQHFQAVTQGMSAFYMYALSKGDDKFLQEFNQFNELASTSLAQSKLEVDLTLAKRWQKLLPTLKFEMDEEAGLSYGGSERHQYRIYVVDLYLRYEQQFTSQNKVTIMFERIQLFNSLLSARALDVASSLWGARAFTDHDRMLDQKKVALQIEQGIKELMSEKLSASQKSALRKVSSKFQFMKKSLVDYQAETAYFLMYRNVMSINKLMSNNQAL